MNEDFRVLCLCNDVPMTSEETPFYFLLSGFRFESSCRPCLLATIVYLSNRRINSREPPLLESDRTLCETLENKMYTTTDTSSVSYQLSRVEIKVADNHHHCWFVSSDLKVVTTDRVELSVLFRQKLYGIVISTIYVSLYKLYPYRMGEGPTLLLSVGHRFVYEG